MVEPDGVPAVSGLRSAAPGSDAAALAGGENDYPELPFPTGYSGEANNKFRDAFDYGMTKGSGKN